jgi:hypothetical protein
MIVAITFLALFAIDNADALNAFEAQQKEGASWDYVGREQRNPDAPAIPLINEGTGDEVIYFRLQ